MNDSTQPQVSWKDRKKQQLRDEFLSIALRLFREQGIGGTSVEDIVSTAGVAKGTFYLYFKSKADVVSEAMGSLLEDLESRISQALSSSPEDARVTLKNVIRTQLAFLQENRGLVSLLLPGCGQGIADAPEELQARVAGVTSGLYERIIRTGMLQTHYRELDARLAARVLIGIVAVLVSDALESGAPLADVEPAALDLFEKGIRRGA